MSESSEEEKLFHHPFRILHRVHLDYCIFKPQTSTHSFEDAYDVFLIASTTTQLAKE
jgi:hypothetical protein